MNPGDSVDLDLNIARARLILAPATLLSIYIDVAKPDLSPWFQLTGGLLEIDRYAFVTLLLHLAYATGVHSLTTFGYSSERFVRVTATIDVLFATTIALFTEGPTSPSLVFFTFAVIAIGSIEGFRATLLVTAMSVVAYSSLILFSSEGTIHDYVMRPVYLAITGYLIAFVGQQRKSFEARVRELESREERHAIARSLHDGYVQALAGVTLRLSGCRRLLQAGRTEAALTELGELQTGVAREYDEIRAYVRSLIELDDSGASDGRDGETLFDVRTAFRVRGPQAEQILLILLEGIRNTMQHADARAATIRAEEAGAEVRITLSDDGVGFTRSGSPPWSIASRVAELGGEMRIPERTERGAHLEIDLPASPQP